MSSEKWSIQPTKASPISGDMGLLIDQVDNTSKQFDIGNLLLTWTNDHDANAFNLNNVGIFTSNATNPANTGAIRLGNNENFCWRNAGNTKDLCFKVQGNDLFIMTDNVGRGIFYDIEAGRINPNNTALILQGSGGGNDNLTLGNNITTLGTNVILGGFNISNVGTLQSDTLELINSGAGSNPLITSNGSVQELDIAGTVNINGSLGFTNISDDITLAGGDISGAGTITSDTLELINSGAGSNPLITSNGSVQELDIAGTVVIHDSLELINAGSGSNPTVSSNSTIKSLSIFDFIGVGTATPETVNGNLITTNSVGITAKRSSGTGNAYLNLESQSASIINMIDLNSGVDEKSFQIITNSGQTNFLTLNDNNSIKHTYLSMSHNTGNFTVDAVTIFSNTATFNHRILGNKGTDIASVDALTLTDGNYFDITGNTTIDFIINTNWQAGSVVTLQFDGALEVRNGTVAVSPNASFLLAGATNFNSSAGDTLTVVFDGTLWREISRSIN